MAVVQRIDEAAYVELVLSEPNETLELVDGVPREKPGMSWDHGGAIMAVAHQLLLQLDPNRYHVRVNMDHLRVASGTYYVPDVAVIPSELADPYRGQPGLPIFTRPLPLVVEVWSPSTGAYDVESKLPDYQRRGDLEIWRIHPYERTLTAWVRQADGSYRETLYRDGIVEAAVLPNVAIDLGVLFQT